MIRTVGEVFMASRGWGLEVVLHVSKINKDGWLQKLMGSS